MKQSPLEGLRNRIRLKLAQLRKMKPTREKLFALTKLVREITLLLRKLKNKIKEQETEIDRLLLFCESEKMNLAESDLGLLGAEALVNSKKKLLLEQEALLKESETTLAKGVLANIKNQFDINFLLGFLNVDSLKQEAEQAKQNLGKSKLDIDAAFKGLQESKEKLDRALVLIRQSREKLTKASSALTVLKEQYKFFFAVLTALKEEVKNMEIVLEEYDI